MFPMKRLTPALVAGLALAACKETTSPESVDTGALTNDVTTISTTFESNAAYNSMTLLSWHFPVFGGTNLVRQALPRSPRRMMDAQRSGVLPRAGAAGPRPAPEDVQALFPVDVLGKTFEWNTTTDAYAATTRSGAPSTGIRIIIYSVNPVGGMPVEPVQELGYLDLTDESTAAADQLGVLLRLGSTTIADYAIAAVTATTSQRLTAAGYITGSTGSGRVDFDLMSYYDLNTGGGDWEYTLTAQAGGQIVFDFHFNGDDTGTGLIRVSNGSNSIEITSTETTTGSTGQIKFNGTVVATMSQSGSNPPVIVGANGHELTQAQKDDLAEMLFAVLGLMLVTVIGILAPAIVVF